MRQTLKSHPDTRCTTLTSIEVDVTRQPGSMVLQYIVTGRICDLLLPLAMPPERTGDLWQHTCFEAFIRVSPGTAYHEFNFAPSTQWAAYDFDGYRSAMTIATGQSAPRIDVSATAQRLELRVDLALLLPLEKSWSMALSAVIEETDGHKSYWALAHPPGKPDFHHADCFAYRLSPMDGK